MFNHPIYLVYHHYCQTKARQLTCRAIEKLSSQTDPHHRKPSTNMPPKFDPNSPENAALITLFTQLGLSSKSASDIVRQPKQVAPLKALVEEFSLADKSLDEKQASALVKLSAGCGKLGQSEKAYIVDKVITGDLKTGDQVSGEW